MYERRVDALNANPASNRVFCTALAIYLRCVKDVKKTVLTCNSNLYYHTLSTFIPRLMNESSCGNISLSTNHTEVFSTAFPTTPATTQPACRDFPQITSIDHNFRLCALFGDPHLKTFTDDRQTCVVEGAWPLIDNEYLSVQVTNVPVVNCKGPSATATNTVSCLTG